MKARLRNLLEERATAWSQVQDIQSRREADGYEPTAEDGETYTRALDDVERLSREIEEEERAGRLDAVMSAPAGDVRATNPRTPGEGSDEGEAGYRQVFERFVRSGALDLSAEDRQTLQERLVSDPVLRAQAAGTGAAGGYTVPTEFRNKLTETLKAFGGILRMAEILTTDSGNPVEWPTNDGTAIKGAIVGENTQVTEQDEVFGQANLGAYMYTSKIIRVSFQLLQDSALDINAFLARRCGERIGRIAADHFAVGTGTGQPQGITVGLTLNQETAVASKVSYDDLVDLEHTVDPAYRGRGRYVLADSVLRELRKLKDTQGRPLWVPSVQAGVPSTLNGHQYEVDNSLPAFAAGAKPLVFGDIEAAYVVRLVNGAQVLRLTERYADFLQVGFLGFQRIDAVVQDAAAAATLTVKS